MDLLGDIGAADQLTSSKLKNTDDVIDDVLKTYS